MTSTPLLAYLTHEELKQMEAALDHGLEDLRSMRAYLNFMAALSNQAQQGLNDEHPYDAQVMEGQVAMFKLLADQLDTVIDTFGEMDDHMLRVLNRA